MNPTKKFATANSKMKKRKLEFAKDFIQIQNYLRKRVIIIKAFAG